MIFTVPFLFDERRNTMDDERFRLIIEDYRLDCQCPERIFRNEERFEKASLCNWALDELTAYVMRRPHKDKLSAVREFARKMRSYMRRYPRTQTVFFTAADVADDIADILLGALTNTSGNDI